jgi:hypothetical protein
VLADPGKVTQQGAALAVQCSVAAGAPTGPVVAPAAEVGPFKASAFT